MLNLLLTLCLTAVAPQNEQASSFEEWLVAYRGELHLEEFLRHELLRDAAESAGILPTAQEIDESLNKQRDRRIENAYGGDHEAWVKGLLRLNLTEETWRKEQRIPTLNTLLVDRLVRSRREISEQDVIAAWEKSYGPSGRGMTVRWIQLPITPPTPPADATREEVRALREASRAADRDRAEEIRQAWESGADFLDLQASTGSGEEPREPFSLDDLPWPDSVRLAVETLSQDEISSPEAARGAWNLIQLVDSTHTPLESVREELFAALLARVANSTETDALFIDLREKSAATISLEESVKSTAPAAPLEIIGQLNGRPLKLGAFIRWLTETHGRPHRDTFQQMQLIERLSITANNVFTPAEVASRREQDLDERVQLFHEGDKARWREELEAKGRTLSGWRRQASIRALHDLRAEALFLAEREVTAEEVHAEWEEVYGEGGVARTVRLISLAPSPPKEQLDPADLEEWFAQEILSLEQLAKELRERVIEGGEDFGALARRHSSDAATRLEGGRLPGLFNLRQQTAAVALAVEPLRAGDVSEPVRILTGYIFIQVIEKKFTPLEEVEDELYSELMLQRPSAVELSSFVNQLFERSKR